MLLSDFDFDLPQALIAQQPVEPRDAARLLHVGRVALEHRQVRDLPGLLRPGDLLVVNDTRVLPARL
ncbi:MAG: S-adenosylmethionine:tRNA ribosyltransferase-isomerase, partial [Tistlia sp.]